MIGKRIESGTGEGVRAEPNWDGVDHVVDRLSAVMTEFELGDHGSVGCMGLDVVWQSEGRG